MNFFIRQLEDYDLTILDSGYSGSLLTYNYVVMSDGEITFSLP